MRILWVSHFDIKGSGYQIITAETCNRLVAAGHDVKVLGFEYKGEEHWNSFSLIPSSDPPAIVVQTQNLVHLWKPDFVVVAFDIPNHKYFLQHPIFNEVNYVGIFPLESDPLILPYATVIAQMKSAWVISRFGVEECKKFGVEANYFDVGVDLEKWRLPSMEERKEFRSMLGAEEDDFVILTVADNQERKNLPRAMQIFKDFHELHPKSKYFLVTREQLGVGWDLRDFARELKIGNAFSIFERGMEFSQLWSIYAAADVFLLTSKAEGAGMPILEAMATGIPVAGTGCTAIQEHLQDGQGYLIPYDYEYVDPFMNGRRYFVSRSAGVETLEKIYADLQVGGNQVEVVREKALKYVEKRNWDNTVSNFTKVLSDLGENHDSSIEEKESGPESN